MVAGHRKKNNYSLFIDRKKERRKKKKRSRAWSLSSMLLDVMEEK